MFSTVKLLLLCIFFGVFAGSTAYSSKLITIGSPIFCYFTKDKVIIDAKRNPKEWTACRRFSYIECKVGQNTYYRHYVWCMYDAEWFYMSIKTYYHPKFGVKHYPVFSSDLVTLSSNSFRIKKHKEPIDNFNLRILSDNKLVLCVEIFSDGMVYQWPFSKAFPKKAEVQNYIKREYGITIATVSTNYSNGNISWESEIKFPLKKLQPLGRKIILDINGAKCKMDFYPNKQSINRSFDEL